jgi:hypothetical protein
MVSDIGLTLALVIPIGKLQKLSATTIMGPLFKNFERYFLFSTMETSKNIQFFIATSIIAYLLYYNFTSAKKT